MAAFKIFRETTLPGTLKPYAIYVVAPTAKPDYIEIYVSNSTGSSAKRVIQDTDVQTLINNSLSAFSSIEVVADIAARDALTPTTNIQVLVLDASADATVASGAATYVYQLSNTTWYKISEHESMDLDLSVYWADIIDGPTSTPAQVDTAVAQSHTHSNKTQLDKVGEDGEGFLTYNGSLPVIAWSSVTW